MWRKSELWGGLFWLACGLFVAACGYDLEIGQLKEPGSGFAFFYIGLLICALALVVVGKAARQTVPDLAALWGGTQWHRVVMVVALLLAYALAFETAGFFLCTVVLLLALMLWVDPVDWRVALPVAVAASWSVDAVLRHWLKINLPDGFLSGWI
ncbi:MAG: tripartite tricarboxylate transporter TctB family protein [Hyphomicrobiales bacterium]|nr:tripartite tricarboxylate transporter TctB family protein [Hyphomicrobiales bacterium]